MAENCVEKIMCFENGNNNSALETAALMNNGNWNNNPFMYLILLAFMNGGFGWGNRGGDFGQLNDLSRQIQSVQGSVNDNHNNDIALQAINGNRDAMGQLAQTFNCSINQIQTAICSVKSAIEQVGGQVGYSAENVKNAIALGDSNIMSKMQECCCNTKTAILEQGYQSQLATERQTNALGSQMAAQHSADQLKDCEYHGQTMSRIDQLATNLAQGLAAMGYENAKNTQALINNENANTQRLLDRMCQKETQDLRDALAQKDRELMTASIVAQLKKECGCGC